MNIAVFGATDGTGREIVRQAIEAGHEITILVRDTAKVKHREDRLYLVLGDVLDIKKVEETLAAADAVVCSLGQAAHNPDNVVLRGTQNIIQAMQKQAVDRLVVVPPMGDGRSINQVSLNFKMLTKTVLRKAIADKERQEALVAQSDLDWVIVRPSGLCNGRQTSAYHTGTDPHIEASHISRTDVAAFVLQQLTDNTVLHQKPAITC